MRNQMTDRAYTIAEIDTLRSACREIWMFGSIIDGRTATSGSYRQQDLDKGTEEMVRTYMLAGITGAELYADAKRKYDERNAAMKIAGQ